MIRRHKIIAEETVWLITSDGRIEIEAPKDLVKDICHSGDNMYAARTLRNVVKDSLRKYPSSLIVKEIEQYGDAAEDIDPNDRKDLEVTLLWLLAWDACDRGELEDDYVEESSLKKKAKAGCDKKKKVKEVESKKKVKARKKVKSSLLRRSILSANEYDTFIRVEYDSDLSKINFDENIEILRYGDHRKPSISFYVDGSIEPSSISEYADKAGFVWDDEKEAYVKGNKEIYEEDLNDEDIEAWEIIASELPDLEIYETRGYSQGDFAYVIIDMDKLEKVWGNKPAMKAVHEDIDHLFWDTPISFWVVVGGDENDDITFNLEDQFGGYQDYDRDEVASYIKERYDREFPEETVELLIGSLPESPKYN